MTEILAYKLPKLNQSTKDFNYENHIASCHPGDNIDQSAKLILQAFDTDDKRGVLSREELGNALNYLRVLENECSIQGQKGDRIISELDFAYAIENDKKFSTIKTQLSKEINIKELAANVLSILQSTLQGKTLERTYRGITDYLENRGKNLNYALRKNKPIYVNQSKDSATYNDGNNKFGFALNKDGQRIDNPNEVAEMLGLLSDFSILKFKTEYCKRINDDYIAYYKWDNNTKEFVKDREKHCPRWIPEPASGIR